MREIKFRAWDEKYKIMIYPENLDKILKRFEGTDAFFEDPLYAPDELYPFSEIKFLRGISILQEDYKDRLKIMQYTGLKDKNGREIYEGDICKVGETADGKDILALIYWDEKTACFRYRFNMVVMLTREDINPKNWEVIGNIYENPELLEEGEE